MQSAWNAWPQPIPSEIESATRSAPGPSASTGTSASGSHPPVAQPSQPQAKGTKPPRLNGRGLVILEEFVAAYGLQPTTEQLRKVFAEVKAAGNDHWKLRLAKSWFYNRRSKLKQQAETKVAPSASGTGSISSANGGTAARDSPFATQLDATQISRLKTLADGSPNPTDAVITLWSQFLKVEKDVVQSWLRDTRPSPPSSDVVMKREDVSHSSLPSPVDEWNSGQEHVLKGFLIQPSVQRLPTPSETASPAPSSACSPTIPSASTNDGHYSRHSSTASPIVPSSLASLPPTPVIPSTLSQITKSPHINHASHATQQNPSIHRLRALSTASPVVNSSAISLPPSVESKEQTRKELVMKAIIEGVQEAVASPPVTPSPVSPTDFSALWTSLQPKIANLAHALDVQAT